jgi:hypothetical protein
MQSPRNLFGDVCKLGRPPHELLVEHNVLSVMRGEEAAKPWGTMQRPIT